MRGLITIFSLVIISTMSAQDTLHIPQAEVDEIIEAIDILTEQDSINNQLISQLEFQINLLETIVEQDSLVLNYKRQEIELLEAQIKLYDDRLKHVDKWYEKRPFGIVLGVLGTVGLIHVIDYTLPE
jgi:hypothetical protein